MQVLGSGGALVLLLLLLLLLQPPLVLQETLLTGAKARRAGRGRCVALVGVDVGSGGARAGHWWR